MDFKAGTNFGTSRTFGDDMTYLGDMLFYGSNTFVTDVFFDTAHDDWANDLQNWGVGPQFFGNTNFVDEQSFPTEARFGANQDFPIGDDHVWGDHAFFDTGTDFNKARKFPDVIHLDGSVTFVGANTWGEGIECGGQHNFEIVFITGSNACSERTGVCECRSRTG